MRSIKDRFFLILTLFTISLFALSCKSAPPPASLTGSGASVQQGPGQEELDELDAAMARAGEAREKALEVQGQVYFPDEWNKAESDNDAGKNAGRNTSDDVKQAIMSFSSAAGGYEAIAENSGPLYAKELEETRASLEAAMARADKSKKDAGDNQAAVYFPDDWEAAEAMYNDGGSAGKDTLEEMKAAAALYASAADMYDDMAEKSRPLLAGEKDNAQKALQAAIARADKSRKDAQSVQAQTYFPADWKNAEDMNASGKNAPKTTAEEIKAAAALYDSAADMYDSIAANSRPMMEKDGAQKSLTAAIARAEKSRQAAVTANGQANLPADWKNAEDKNTSAKNAKKTTADEIKAATALYISAADAYDDIAKKSVTLNKEKDDANKSLQAAIARAEKSRQAAVDGKAQTAFPNEWKNAEAKNTSAKNAKKSTAAEMKAAVPLYTAAADAYDDIVKKNTARLAEDAQKSVQDAKSKAEKERQGAIDVKANVAVKDDFNKADTVFQQALKDYNAKSYSSAADKYNQSASLFAAVAQAAGGKRVLAEDAIGKAKQKSAESAAFAENTELSLEGNNE